jgi:uncharacterized protein (DUF2267 family)
MTREEFLERVQTTGALASQTEAERWSAAATRALAQLLPESELRRHFVSQLPGFLKSRLQDHPPPALSMDREALIQHVAAALDAHAAQGERALRTVYGVLKQAVSPGQIAEFEAHVPGDVALFLRHAP